jgi:hypothetical protein
MTLPAILFVVFAIALVFLLAWATRPPKLITLSDDQVLAVLSLPCHCMRVHIVLQFLRPDDTDLLKECGNPGLRHELRSRRRQIALHYLQRMEEEYETLLEASRRWAIKTTAVTPMEEMTRWKLSLLFSLRCTALRWRMLLGLRPADGFLTLSALSLGMIRHLEAATLSIAESTAASGKFGEFEPSTPESD